MHLFAYLIALILTQSPAWSQATQDHCVLSSNDELPDLTTLTDQMHADIDQLLLNAAKAPTLVIAETAMIEIMRKYPHINLAWIENRLRNLNTHLYLLSAPREDRPSNLKSRSVWGFPEEDLQFHLHLHRGPYSEVEGLMQEWGLTKKTNLERMPLTGILRPKY